MIAFPKILYSLFADKQPSATLVPIVQKSVQDENVTLGCEFLDDFLRLDEPSDDETEL